MQCEVYSTHDVAGKDLRISLLHILNNTKGPIIIPDMMKKVNVVMLPKPGKPSLHQIENHRGVFLISVFRSILMKLLLKDEYETIDSNMSDSNIGGRKERQIQDHIFIVNGYLFAYMIVGSVSILCGKTRSQMTFLKQE